MSYALKIDNNPENFKTVVASLKKEYQRACDSKRDKTALEPLLTDVESENEPDKAVSFAAEEYSDFVLKFLGPTALSEEDLANRLRYFNYLFTSGQFSEHIVQGTKIWLMLFPLDGYGYEFDSADKLSQCYVGPKGLTNGFTPTPAYYYDLFPENLRSCCFEVPKFSGEFGLPTLNDFNTFIERYSEAYRKLMEVLM